MSPSQSSGAAPARGQKQSRRAEAAHARIWAKAIVSSGEAYPISAIASEALGQLHFDPRSFRLRPAACYRAFWQLPGPDLGAGVA